jgi:hypothetical protein
MHFMPSFHHDNFVVAALSALRTRAQRETIKTRPGTRLSTCKLYKYVTLKCSMARRSVRFGVRSRKLINVGQSLDGWPIIYYLELLCASEGTLSRGSRLHLQSLAPTNPHWARVVGYGPFSLRVIHKASANGDVNRLMMIRTLILIKSLFLQVNYLKKESEKSWPLILIII